MPVRLTLYRGPGGSLQEDWALMDRAGGERHSLRGSLCSRRCLPKPPSHASWINKRHFQASTVQWYLPLRVSVCDWIHKSECVPSLIVFGGPFISLMRKSLIGLDIDRGGAEKEIFKANELWYFQRKIVLAPDLILLNILGLGNQMNENVRKGHNQIQRATAHAMPY